MRILLIVLSVISIIVILYTDIYITKWLGSGGSITSILFSLNWRNKYLKFIITHIVSILICYLLIILLLGFNVNTLKWFIVFIIFFHGDDILFQTVFKKKEFKNGDLKYCKMRRLLILFCVFIEIIFIISYLILELTGDIFITTGFIIITITLISFVMIPKLIKLKKE